jgi:hypothetical protein
VAKYLNHSRKTTSPLGAAEKEISATESLNTIIFSPMWPCVAQYFKFHPFLQNSLNGCMLNIFIRNHSFLSQHKFVPFTKLSIMKLLPVFLLIMAPYCSMAQPKTAFSSAKEILIRNVHLIPMDSERIIESQDILIANGRITTFGKTGSIKYAPSTLIIDGKGKFLMPGLGEMHAHVPPIDDMEPMKEVLTLFALNGVTTIRGMLGHPQHLVLRDKLQSGELSGPRFITSGPSFNGNSVKTAEQGEAMVEAQKKSRL